jgi:hypothetical protein
MLGLTILGFYLPSESGERMGVGITVLLSLSIIQLMLSDSLPPNEEVPLIVRYYGLTMFNVFLSLVFTCMVLKLYHTDNEPLSGWIKTLLCDWGAWVVRLQDEWRNLQEKRKLLELKDNRFLCDSDTVEALPSKYCEVTWSPNGDTNSGSTTSETISNKILPGKAIPETSKKFEKFIFNQQHNEKIDELLKEEWKFASKVLNIIFKWTIGISVLINSIVVFAEAPLENLFDWLPK